MAYPLYATQRAILTRRRRRLARLVQTSVRFLSKGSGEEELEKERNEKKIGKPVNRFVSSITPQLKAELRVPNISSGTEQK